MRILHVCPSLRLGGSIEVAIDLAIGLKMLGHDVFLYGIGLPRAGQVVDNQKRRLDCAGVKYVGFNVGKKYIKSPVIMANLLWQIYKMRPDIVHGHSIGGEIVAAIAQRVLKVKAARTIHLARPSWSSSYLSAFVNKIFADELVVSVGTDVQESFCSFARRRKSRVSLNQIVIHNGVNKKPIAESPGPFKLISEKKNILFAGRFSFQKGFDVLAEAIMKISKPSLNKLHFHLVGQGISDQKDLYEESIKHYRKYEDSVTIYEPIPCVSRYFRYFEAILMPSRFEGLPLVGLEAIVQNVLLIGSDGPGIREIYPDGWPWIFKAGDAESLARILERFSKEERIEKYISDLKAVEKRFDIENTVKQYEAAYLSYIR